MGTNFYVKGHCDDDNPKYHIGKRSAAGLYCWDCGITLCVGGEEAIHRGTIISRNPIRYRESTWLKSCPKCGKQPEDENMEHSSAGRELGFNKTKPEKKTGVRSCASFTWARPLGKIRLIVDEYGREYSIGEFKKVLEECPIQFFGSIGKGFS